MQDFDKLDKIGKIIFYKPRLGEGKFSQVFKVKRKADNLEYAMKQVKISKFSDKDKYNAMQEVRMLYSIKSHNVIGYKEAFIDPESGHLW
jgi:NIMA (never in mitosis gene a)-related kinase